MDYSKYYDLERYLLDTVRHKFEKTGYLSAFDFFCIVIWKANRSKSKIAQKLLDRGYANLDIAVRAITKGIAKQKTPKGRLCYLVKEWDFRLPMASSILTVLYPEIFTVYDVRVCNSLKGFHNLANLVNSETLWQGYEKFKQRVSAVLDKKTLRDKDRFLWGKSFYMQLRQDIKGVFDLRGKSRASPSG